MSARQPSQRHRDAPHSGTDAKEAIGNTPGAKGYEKIFLPDVL